MRAPGALGGLVCVVSVALLACDDDTQAPPEPEAPVYTYALVDAYPGLSFTRPVDVQHAGDGSNRIFVVEQTGRIVHFLDDSTSSVATQFLAVDSVRCCNEEGMLGLAFHPAYASNGTFFVYYITDVVTRGGSERAARLSRFQVSAGNPDVADPLSETILLQLIDRADNHNGGSLFFGADGYLYVAIGDEGGGGDFFDNAQNRGVLFGKILRLDVDQNAGVAPHYGIPPDNPFVGNANGYREEIYAWGFRNPWRVTYDAASDRIWAGDVGQVTWEEVDIVVKGGNYGWDCREGSHTYTGPPAAPSPLCASATGLIDPVYDYEHTGGARRSITGGYVYRGPTVTSLTGRYVFSDFMTGELWALAYSSGVATVMPLLDADVSMSTFGVTEGDELLGAGYDGDGLPSKLWRIQQEKVER